MKRMKQKNKNRKFEVDDVKVSRETVEVIMGEKGTDEINEDWNPVIKAIDDPDELPFLLADIDGLEASDDLRMALIRAQVHAQLKMKEDIDYYKRQLFASKTIELLLYKRLRLKSVRERRKKNNNK
ncbi:MAG: hypothetical protein ACQESD_02260 [Thermoplasmatota archaeon]